MLKRIKVFAQQENIVFKHFSIDQGISSFIAPCILQDKEENFWLGTLLGFEKLDRSTGKFTDPEEVKNN